MELFLLRSLLLGTRSADIVLPLVNAQEAEDEDTEQKIINEGALFVS